MEEDDASEAVESQSGSDKEDENNESDLDDDQIIVDRTSKARKSVSYILEVAYQYVLVLTFCRLV